MGFCEMIEKLQERNKGKIVLCRNGNFYIAIGKDAIALNNILNLKLTCFKPQQVCKVGFPKNALEKYRKLLIEKNYSFAIYDFNSEKAELRKICEVIGKYKNEEIISNKCYMCPSKLYDNVKKDKYILAIEKLLESEENRDGK